MSRTMHRVVTVCTAALVSVAGLLVASPAAHASSVIHVVGTNPGDVDGCGSPSFACKTIQYAVNHAGPDDTVEVDKDSSGPLTYSENVTITNPVTLTAGPGVTLTGTITIADAGPGTTTTVTGLHFANGGGIAVTGNTGDTALTGNTFDNVTGTAIALSTPGPDPMSVTVGGNDGTVVSPAPTITEDGPVTVSVPTLNTISPTSPTPTVDVTDQAVKIVPDTGPRQLGTADAAVANTDLSFAHYDVSITSPDTVDANDVALTYTTAADGTQSATLIGSTQGGGALTAAIPYPASTGSVTFAIAALVGGRTGTLHVVLALHEYTGDGTLVNEIATDSGTVDDVSDAGPQYGDRTVYIHADGSPTPVDITATESDADPVSYSIIDAPTAGTLSGTAPTLTYTPSGTAADDSFTYQVSDGYVTGQSATVTIKVNHVPPATVGAQTVHNVGTTTFAITPTTDSIDGGQPLTYSIPTNPGHGTASISGYQVSYTPAAGYTGPDSIGYTVFDGVDKATGTIAVTVNQAPDVADFSQRVKHAGATTIQLGPAADNDGQALTYSVKAGPAHGSLGSISGNQVSYTPGSDNTGTDSFEITASDGVDSKDFTVSITVNKVPVVTAQPFRVHNSGATTITISPAVDGDGQTLTYARTQQSVGPSHGTLGNFVGNQVNYTPNSGYTGTDSFVVTASDGLESTTATISITVNKLAPSPTQTVRVHASGATTIDLGPSVDTEGQPLTYSPGSTAPANGMLGTITNDTVTYTPIPGKGLTDSFSISVSDGTDTVPGLVSVIVNKPPQPQNQTDLRVSRLKATTIKLGPTKDSEQQSLRYTVETGDGPTNGVLGTISGGKVTYTPSAGAPSTDSFIFTVDDKTDARTGVISLDINTPPTASAHRLTTAFGHAAAITLGPAKDADGDTIRYAVKAAPSHGSLSPGPGGTRTYTPTAGYAGSDSFTYTAADSLDTVGPATVTITVAKAGSALTLSLSPRRPTSAQHPTLTVHVASAGNTTNGFVTVGAQKARVRKGEATFTLPQYTGGTHTVSATFGGTRTARSTTAKQLQFTVRKVATRLGLTTDPVAITARTKHAVLIVTIHAGPVHPSSGVITVVDQLNNNPPRRLGTTVPRNGTARFNLPQFVLGQHNLSVSYVGTAYVAAATAALTERVPAG